MPFSFFSKTDPWFDKLMYSKLVRQQIGNGYEQDVVKHILLYEARMWLQDNEIAYHTAWHEGVGSYIRFQNPEDAMRFKLAFA